MEIHMKENDILRNVWISEFSDVQAVSLLEFTKSAYITFTSLNYSKEEFITSILHYFNTFIFADEDESAFKDRNLIAKIIENN
jgi:hypothetical protein